MGETANQIESYIDQKRENLGSNLQELEQKVKSAADWRWQFQKNPMTMIGAAFGGGVLLAATLGGGKRRRRDTFRYRDTGSGDWQQHAGTEHQKQRALDVWDSIKGALIGVAATQFKGVLGQVVPGFNEQFQKTEAEKERTTRHTQSLAANPPVVQH